MASSGLVSRRPWRLIRARALEDEAGGCPVRAYGRGQSAALSSATALLSAASSSFASMPASRVAKVRVV